MTKVDLSATSVLMDVRDVDISSVKLENSGKHKTYLLNNLLLLKMSVLMIFHDSNHTL